MIRKVFRISVFFVIVALTLFTYLSQGQATDKVVPIARAEGEVLQSAVGHFARSRSLLVAAIREFDRGLKLVDPDSIVDVQRFRTTLLDRSEELERLLDPQPRVTRSGIKFSPDVRLLGEANQ